MPSLPRRPRIIDLPATALTVLRRLRLGVFEQFGGRAYVADRRGDA